MKALFIILLLFCPPTFADGKIEDKKANMIMAIDRQIQALEQAKSCLSSASTKEALKACKKSKKETMKSIKKQRKEDKKRRKNERKKSNQQQPQ